MAPVSITLVSGWLGSGKTTFLNRLLSDAASTGRRIAVLQNEFGDIGLDGRLLEGAIAGLYELSSGCLCCTVHDDFMALIEEILRMETPPEAIVVETTGVADPSVPLVSLLQHVDYGDTFEVDGVITLVDAVDFARSIDEHPEVQQQIAVADLLLINKSDQVSALRIEEIRGSLQEINPQARVVVVAHGNVGAEGLDPFDLGGLDSRRTSLDLPLRSTGQDHTGGIGAISFATNEPFDQERLHEVLEDIFADYGEQIYRAKGIFRTTKSPNELVLQGVRSRYSWQFRIPTSENEESRCVIIGKELPAGDLHQRLASATTTTTTTTTS